jgi:guanine deaminase
MTDEELMRCAIRLSKESVTHGGGPFGAVIAKAGAIIAQASNSVTLSHDPTAHAEVNAIRLAAQQLGTHDLSGYDIYCSCEPCPMCLGAIYWAHLDRIFYANSRRDAAAIGFDDDFIYNEFSLPPEQRHKTMLRILPLEALEAFRMWDTDCNKKKY